MKKESFEILYKPFYSKKFYKEFVTRNRCNIYIMIIIFAIVTAIPFVVRKNIEFSSPDINSAKRIRQIERIKNLPQMELKNGVLYTNTDEPILYHGAFDIDLHLIDPSITKKNLREKVVKYDEIAMCFGKTEVYPYPNNNEEPLSISYSLFVDDGVIDQNRLLSWFDTIDVLFEIFASIAMIPFFFIFYLLHFFALKLIARIAWKHRTTSKKDFDTLIIVATIPAVTLFVFLSKSVSSPKFFVLSLILTSIYITLGLQGYKEDSVVKSIKSNEDVNE